MKSRKTSGRSLGLKDENGLQGEERVSINTSYLEGHEEISKETRSPRRVGGSDAKKDISQENLRFPR